MRGAVIIAVLSARGWCDSIGDGCVPLFSDPVDTASGGASSTSAPGDNATHVPELTTGDVPTSTHGDASADSTQGDTRPTTTSDGTTLDVPQTTSTTTDPDAQTTAAATTADTTGTPAKCGDGTVSVDEECDGGPDLENGVLECDDSCKALRAVDIAAGSDHACILLNNGRVRCWGDNGEQQLGAGGPLTDVTLDDLPLSAVAIPGAINLDVDVHFDTGNGRIFAGGSTSCLTAANAVTTWCWGQGFGAAPIVTKGAYSAIAIRDVLQANQDWWMCGLEWTDPEYRLRCWGSLPAENKALFESVANHSTCFNTVTEDNAGVRVLDLAGKPPKLDLGRELGCAPSADHLLCAGNDGTLCEGDPFEKPCTANSFHNCPSGCEATPCSQQAADVAIWEGGLCYIPSKSPQQLDCYRPGLKVVPLKTACTPTFSAQQIALSQDFWCALDRQQPPGGQVCCQDFSDPPTGGIIKTGGQSDTFRKASPQRNSILLLQDNGRIRSISLSGDQWSTSDPF